MERDRTSDFRLPLLSGILLGAVLMASFNEVLRGGVGLTHLKSGSVGREFFEEVATGSDKATKEFLPIENAPRTLQEEETDEPDWNEDETDDVSSDADITGTGEEGDETLTDDGDDEDVGVQEPAEDEPEEVPDAEDTEETTDATEETTEAVETTDTTEETTEDNDEATTEDTKETTDATEATTEDTKETTEDTEETTEATDETKEDTDDKKESSTKKESAEKDNEESTKQEERKTKDKPLNVLLLYADDWRYDSIGAEGGIVHTPFLDAFAKEGIRFTHNCVTSSICWISRATLYTGHYVSRHKSTYPQHTFWYDGWNETLPHLFREAGYYTGHIGKWHFPWIEPVVSSFDYSNPYYGDHWYRMNGKKVHTTTRSEQDAIQFLQRRPKDKPFFVGVCFFAPHSVDHEEEQFFPQPKSMKLYENDTIEVPPNGDDAGWNKLPYFFGDINEGRRRWRLRYSDDEKRQRMQKNYYRLISEIDYSSKKIVQELKKQGELDNTLIIFTTDNGMYLSEHGLSGKWYPHQESIRVPLVIRDPRMPKDKVGTLNDDFTLNIDLASTILGAAGIKQPERMQGRDIADLYMTKDPKWRDEFFYEHPVHLDTKVIPASTALVRKDYKLIIWPDYNVTQLFNLKEDPYEMNDIVNRSDLKSLVKEMRQVHDRLQKEAL